MDLRLAGIMIKSAGNLALHRACILIACDRNNVLYFRYHIFWNSSFEAKTEKAA